MTTKFQLFAQAAKRLKEGTGTPEDTMLLLKEPLLAIMVKFKSL
jgi:hypothetical protein